VHKRRTSSAPCTTMKELPLSEQQCDAGNVLTMLVPLAALLVWALTRSRRWRGTAISAIVIACSAYGHSRGIADLTLGHQMVGMLATYAGVKVAEKPYFVVTTVGELFGIVLMILPNALVVMTETFHTMHPFMFRTFDWFRRNAFFHKQHALLHFGICVMLISLATSYWMGDPRLRRSPRVAMVRAILEPACLTVTANVLSTHQHNVPDATDPLDSSHLPTHAYIALFMFASATLHLVTGAAHLSWPAQPDGAPAPLATPALTMLRLVTAFAYLLLSYFLYLVTFFQYLGCRHELFVVGTEGEPGANPIEYTREGLTIASETSTYLALATLASALTLACLVPAGGDAPAVKPVPGGRGAPWRALAVKPEAETEEQGLALSASPPPSPPEGTLLGGEMLPIA